MSSQRNVKVLFSRQEVADTVRRLADEINDDYRGKNPLIIGILIGSFVFIADLVRLLEFPLEMDFVRLASYGSGTVSSGKVKIAQELSAQIRGRDVLVVEDIVDTGHTLAFLMDYLAKKEPATLKLCVLVDKPSRRLVPVTIDYLGFTVPDEFIVGYGIDWNEKYRNIPDICILGEGE